MKPNAFQKILILVYTVLLSISCIFFVPFRVKKKKETEIIYDVLWSNKSDIDLYRICIYLFLLSVTFYFLYNYLSKVSNIESISFKKKAKNELLIFIFFVISILGCIAFLHTSNLINEQKHKSLADKILKTATLIEEKSNNKQNIRADFWYTAKSSFEQYCIVKKGGTIYRISHYYINEYERDGYTKVTPLLSSNDFEISLQEFWGKLIQSKDDNVWLSTFYLNLSDEYLEDKGLKNKDNLKKFIEDNNYNEEDAQKYNEVKVLESNLSSNQSEISSLRFYQIVDIRRITLYFISILFGILYIVRPLFFFIKGIYFDLK